MEKLDSLIPIEKRILIHLLGYIRFKPKSTVPMALTQNGIAQAIAASRGYTPRPLKNLVTNGYVKESFGRVKGRNKKQKYYMLTHEGEKYINKFQKEVSKQQITLKHPDGTTKSMKLSEIEPYLKNTKIYPSITEQDIYNMISKDSTIDIDYLKNIKKVQWVDFTSDAPRVMHFFGRKREMAILEKWVEDKESHNIIFIHGMAGIGKTTLTAKLIENQRGSKHLFWHNFHNLDTLRGVLFRLSEFLSKLGHDHLEMYIRTRTSLDSYEISRILEKSIGKLDATLIFDDFHKSNDKIRAFFVYLLRMLTSSSKTKILILSREIVPFYDSREVLTKKIVAEMELEGLDFESSKRLLTEKGIDKRRFKEIYGFTAGNPLFLEILESKDHLERYVHDELFSKLGEDERKILGIISIYRFPVPEDSLVMNKDFSFEKLYALTQKSIVKKDSHNRYFVHDILKQFFYTRLSPTKRRRHHSLAAKWYRNSDAPIDLIEAIYHYLEGGKHIKAAQLAMDSSASILDGGYAGEFLAILERFNEKNVESSAWPGILILKGKACYMGGDWKKALLYFTESSDMASIIGDRGPEVEAICESGHILEEQNQFDKAMDCFNKCLEISKKAEYLSEKGETYRGIGRIHWRNSEHKKAILSYEKCLEISEKVNDLELLASTWIDLGNVYDEMYETEKAIECYNKSLDILKKTKNTSETARAYGNLAIMYRRVEEFDKAIEYGGKFLELAKNLHNLKLMGYGYAGVSYCYAKINKWPNARDYVKKAGDIASKIDNENIMYQVNKTYALISREEKKWEEAVKLLKKNIVFVEKLKHLYGLSDAHFELALTYDEMGDLNNAKKHFKITSNLYNELGLGNTKFVRDKFSKYKQYISKK
ncbi:MAG: ATP-binding protein [Methanomassiliicoccales archaeon]|nr:MAG: ATP-binding protein [Methanomassiliicoccales archaeon]